MSSPMESVRTFVCLQLPPLARDRLAATQQRLRESGAPVSWVRPHNIHLTMKFLGAVSPERLQDVVRGVRRAAVPAPPIPLELTEAGLLPQPAGPQDYLGRTETASRGIGDLAAEGRKGAGWRGLFSPVTTLLPPFHAGQGSIGPKHPEASGGNSSGTVGAAAVRSE